MLKYIQKFQENEEEANHTFHLITFEQREYPISPSAKLSIQNDLRNSYRINWTPLKYHSGGILILFKKILDVLSVFLIAIKVLRKEGLQKIIGFTAISGSISYLVSKTLNVPLVLLNIEPHSDYMTDFGYWSKRSISYKILNALENRQMRHAAFLAVPTQNAYDLLKKDDKIKDRIHFVPTSIDLDNFSFSQSHRDIIRNKIGVNEETKVLVYIGKFGGIYYSIEEMATTCQELANKNDNLFFYIITSDNIEEVRSIFNAFGLKGKCYLQGRIPYEEISMHLSAGDMGLLFIPSYPSQLFRCPIKTANYLACGLPYLITNNIGDDSKLAEELDIGLVLNQNVDIVELLEQKNFDRQKLQKTVYRLRNIQLVVDFLKISLS